MIIFKKLISLIKSNIIILISFCFIVSFLIWKHYPQYKLDHELINQSIFDNDYLNINAVDINNNKLVFIKDLDIKNKKTIFYFFATWCGICNLELDTVKKSFNEFKNNNFNIYAFSSEDLNKLSNFKKNKKINYNILQDSNNVLHNKFKINGYPTIIWIDQNSKIVNITHGLDLFLFYKIKSWLK